MKHVLTSEDNYAAMNIRISNTSDGRPIEDMAVISAVRSGLSQNIPFKITATPSGDAMIIAVSLDASELEDDEEVMLSSTTVIKEISRWTGIPQDRFSVIVSSRA